MASARLPRPSHAVSPPSPPYKLGSHRKAAVRCQSLDDEGRLYGRPMDMVDANLKLLRERIEDLRKKEGRPPPTCRRRLDNGWSYLSSNGNLDRSYGEKRKENYRSILECLEVMGIVGGAVGVVVVIGSLGIFLVSVIVHHLCI